MQLKADSYWVDNEVECKIGKGSSILVGDIISCANSSSCKVILINITKVITTMQYTAVHVETKAKLGLNKLQAKSCNLARGCQRRKQPPRAFNEHPYLISISLHLKIPFWPIKSTKSGIQKIPIFPGFRPFWAGLAKCGIAPHLHC